MSYTTGPISSFDFKVPSSTDIVPIVDTSDPFVKNKKTNISSIFKAVPFSSGTTTPAIAFDNSQYSGIFSPEIGKISLRLGNSDLYFYRHDFEIETYIDDPINPDLDLSFSALGNGKIKFNSEVNFTDQNFSISNQINTSNKILFDLSQLTDITTLTVPDGTSELVTTTAPQILSNKSFSDTSVNGQFWVNILTQDLYVSNGKVGIGLLNPETRLHVYGDTRISGQYPTLQLGGISKEYRIVNNNSNSFDIQEFGLGTIFSVSSTGASSNTWIGRNIRYQQDLTVSNFSTGLTGIYIGTGGSVGIGASYASTALDVNGSARILGGLLKPNTLLKVMDYTNSLTTFYGNLKYNFGSGTTTFIEYDQNIKIGIGVTAPASTLEVRGAIVNSQSITTAGVASRVINTAISGNILTLDLDSGRTFQFIQNQTINSIQYNLTNREPNTEIKVTLVISHDGFSYPINWGSYTFWIPTTGTGTTVTQTAPTLQTAGAGVTYGLPSKDIIELTSYVSADVTSGALPVFIGRLVARIPAL